MLLPLFTTAAAASGPAIILFGQEREMPHGFFGDRDAGVHAPAPRIPPYCGLFGRRGDALPPRRPGDDDQTVAEQTPRGRA